MSADRILLAAIAGAFLLVLLTAITVTAIELHARHKANLVNRQINRQEPPDGR